MMPYRRQLKTFESVPAATTATTTVYSRLTLGEKIRAIHLVIGDSAGTTIGSLASPTLLGDIRLKINSNTQWQISAQELSYLNTMRGARFGTLTTGTPGDAGYRTRLSLFFAEPWRNGIVRDSRNGSFVRESELGALNLLGISDALLEVDFRASITSPIIGGYYEFEAADGNIGAIKKIYRETFGTSAIAPDITTLSKARGPYQAMHLFPTSDYKYVESLKLTRNTEEVRQDITRYENDAILIRAGFNPTSLDTTSNTTKTNTGVYSEIFDYTDQVEDFLSVGGSRELTLKPTFDGVPSGALKVISEVIGNPD